MNKLSRRSRIPGLQRLSEDQVNEERTSDILHHTEVQAIDNRRRVSALKTSHAIPKKKVVPVEEAAKSMFPDWCYDEDFVATVLGREEEEPGRKRYLETDHPLLDWIPRREVYLRELLHLEGYHRHLVCRGCLASSAPSYYRCRECFNDHLYCDKCIVAQHQANPFHWIEKWNGLFFVRTHLRDLNLTVQLGHPVGETCPTPSTPTKNDFIVVDTNGIHRVKLVFCRCGDAADPDIQLLRAKLFPATGKWPHTAATFQLLHAFQLQSFLSKVSPYEYYSTLRRLTDNTGEDVPERYKQFLQMVRQWRHLKLLKRSGRGHVDKGISTTSTGQCAVLCPACPHPGINLPADYNTRPNSWIYRLFQAKDANFRMKRYNVSNTTVDPCLNEGSAFVVARGTYHQFLDKLSGNEKVKEDPSECSNHDAIKSASSKGDKTISITGIAAVECSRHDTKRPASVTTLQKGERYINMDYAYFSSLQQNAPAQVVESYDVVCQWEKKLPARLLEYFPWFTVDLLNTRVIKYLVPKWHLAAHRDSCRTAFSFNFTPGVGRTDGEAPERGWAALNDIAVSAKEMGPGAWGDTLDDYLGDYNWRKYIAMHASLLTKLVDAVPERADHVLAFLDFSKAIAKTRLDLVQSWTTLVRAWEADKSKPNPFVATSKETLTLSTIRLQLAEEDSKDIATKNGPPIVHKDISPSRLLSLGLEIEDQQRKLAADFKSLGPHATPLQRSKLVERRNNLMHRVTSWVEVQHLYVPALAAIRQEAEGSSIAESYDLKMPSVICERVNVTRKLLEQEWMYRQAQADATLDSLRGRLLMQGKMSSSKRKWSHGQHTNTRSHRLMKTVEEKIRFDAAKYNDVRNRLQSLAKVLNKPRGWTKTYQVLLPEDVRGIDSVEGNGMVPELVDENQPAQQQLTQTQPPTGKHQSEGRRTFSWIWKQIGVADTPVTLTVDKTGVNETLRIEWCKARARAHRWQEECELIIEEMRRVKEFYQYEMRRWESIGRSATNAGHRAYAYRQAELRERLYIRCNENWARVNEFLEMGAGGPEVTDAGERNVCVEYEHNVHNVEEDEDEDGEDGDEGQDDHGSESRDEHGR